MTMTRAVVLVAMSLAVGTVIAAPASAKSSKWKRLRAEVARLEARIASLEQQTAQQAQRLALVPPAPAGFCGDPCATDSDGDGLGDCEDPCPCDPDHRDTDGDGWPDCLDPCPDDAENACIGVCRAEPGDGGTAASDCPLPCSPETGVDCEPVPPTPPIPPEPGECRRTGCSGQLCAADDIATTCEWLPEYACYAKAVCEHQPDGDCAWTITPEAAACLANPPR